MNTIINLHNIKFFNPQQIPIPQTQLHQRAKTNRTTPNFIASLKRKQPHNAWKKSFNLQMLRNRECIIAWQIQTP